MGIDNPVHLIFLAAVALLVLGPRRLPEVARSLGKGIREFREAMNVGAGDAAPPPEQLPLAQVVDPVEPVRSGDAPDRRPL
ncbi:MAG: twin-arginine translocase TatA/TatE family subunit [Solirubrobacteraceae bacterium]|jgi:sec-independent protein translocase protein TatA